MPSSPAPLNGDRLQSQTTAVPWLALFREHGWQILQWHGSLSHTHTHTHTHTHIYKHMHTKLLCDTRLEARVTHANETGPASSRQHSVILHSSASLQKPKSFSPPSPVIVILMERRSGNHLFSHTVRRTRTPFYVSVSFSLLKKASHTQIPILYLAPDTCNEQKLICKVTEFLLIQRRRVIRQEAHRVVRCRVVNSDISSVSFRSMSQL